jgi:hypothetical protein
MSPDWSANLDPVPYADLENPQTLNLYNYIQKNPLSRRDATGHYSCDPDTSSTNGNGGTVVTCGACHLELSDLSNLEVVEPGEWEVLCPECHRDVHSPTPNPNSIPEPAPASQPEPQPQPKSQPQGEPQS